MKIRKQIIEAVALFYVCLWLYSGISKLMDYDLNLEQLGMMPVIGPIGGVLAWGLPVVEILLAIVTFIPKTRITGLYMSTGFMFLFIGYIGILMNADSELPCTCGGFLQMLSWPQHVVFNIICALFGVLAIYFHKQLHVYRDQRIIPANL